MSDSGGILSGNVKSIDAPVEKGSRYDQDTPLGPRFRKLSLSGTELEAFHYLEGAIVSGLLAVSRTIRYTNGIGSSRKSTI